MTRSPRLALLLLSSLAAIACGAVACSGPDYSRDEGSTTPTTSSPTEPTSKDGGVAEDDDVEGEREEDSGVTDAAQGVDAAKPASAFTGAPAYAAKLGPATRKAGHSFAKNTPQTNPAGKACLDCHAGGGAPAFAAAGTVYEGAKPAASVEVRVFGADGVARSAFTNADGNFFFRAAGQPLAFPALAGVRNATGTTLMTGHATKGNCNECHSVAGGAGRIVVTP